MGGYPQGGGLVARHGGAAPHRRRHQDDAVGGERRLGPRRHQHAAAHAVAQRVHRHAGIGGAGGGEEVAEVRSHCRGAGPLAGLRRRAEAALVIGQDSDAVVGQKSADIGKGVAVIVEAVQRDHDGFRFALGLPASQRQFQAVGGGETGFGQLRGHRSAGVGAGVLQARRAGGQHGHRQQNEDIGARGHRRVTAVRG